MPTTAFDGETAESVISSIKAVKFSEDHANNMKNEQEETKQQ